MVELELAPLLSLLAPDVVEEVVVVVDGLEEVAEHEHSNAACCSSHSRRS